MKKFSALILASVFGFAAVTGYAATTTATATPAPTAVKAAPTKAAPKAKKQHKVHTSAASKKVAKTEVKKTN